MTDATEPPRRYRLYLDADLNRVFTQSLLDVAAAELRFVFDALDLAITSEIERMAEGRTQYLSFASDAPEDRIAATIGRLSASAALFRLVDPAAPNPVTPNLDAADGADEADEPLLRPIGIAENLVFGSDLVTIQRYKGKTNERFTRAMLNTALATAGIDLAEAAGVVLDPMCGRGTTLNWALAYGLDAIGIEADGGSLDHHAGFLQTWAKRQRLPHNFQRFRSNNAEHRCASLEIAPDRATLKKGGQQLQTFNADAAETGLAIKRGSIDVIVTDLPYGVQHRGSASGTSSGSQAADGHGGPGGPDTVELLERVVPVWQRWLRPGGVLCVAWNTKRAGRRDVSRVLAEAGLAPVTVSGGYSMRHTVDASVDRDVILARR